MIRDHYQNFYQYFTLCDIILKIQEYICKCFANFYATQILEFDRNEIWLRESVVVFIFTEFEYFFVYLFCKTEDSKSISDCCTSLETNVSFHVDVTRKSWWMFNKWLKLGRHSFEHNDKILSFLLRIWLLTNCFFWAFFMHCLSISTWDALDFKQI